jgi:hypothetical protein
MTVYEGLSLLVSAAGFFTVLVSLYLLHRQTTIFAKQADYLARSFSSSFSQSMNDFTHQISRLFIQYPELRPYFYMGRTIEETHPDYLRAEAVAEVILDIFWTMAQQAERFMTPNQFNEGQQMWLEYVGDCFAQSPILVKVLLQRQHWYGERMVAEMHKGIERAKQRTGAV